MTKIRRILRSSFFLFNQFTSIGGQAVIEGVMMRSPHFVAVAVRQPDSRIRVKCLPYKGLAETYPLLKKPILRGVAVLLESMFQGIDALSYSASAAGQATQSDSAKNNAESELSDTAIFGSILVAFVMGIGLFVALPHLLAAFITKGTGASFSSNSPVFHAIDGLIKLTILLLYVYLIAFIQDIRRVFQYHGAEHQSIYTFESGEDLTVENAKKHTTLHPRCGTSFLLFLMVISIIVFSAVFPVLGIGKWTSIPLLNHLLTILTKVVLMFPVAGISYEVIRASACRMDRWQFKLLIAPGLMLQKLTTRIPDDSQLEVALVSLRQVLRLEKGADTLDLARMPQKFTSQDPTGEITVASLVDLGRVQATVAEFPEM